MDKKRKTPYSRIRLIGNENINAVFNTMESKAKQTYKSDFVDIEVQMLSKLCNAIKEFDKIVKTTK